LNNYLSKKRLHNNLLHKNIPTDYAKLRGLVIEDRQLSVNYSVLSELTTTGKITSKLIGIFPLEAIQE